MKEFKGTKGNWYIERTSSEEGDFQCRILSNVGKVWHAGKEKDQIMIIVGEPTKRNGTANIHYEPNAKLIANAPKMLEYLTRIVTEFEKDSISSDLKDVIFDARDFVNDKILD